MFTWHRWIGLLIVLLTLPLAACQTGEGTPEPTEEPQVATATAPAQSQAQQPTTAPTFTSTSPDPTAPADATQQETTEPATTGTTVEVKQEPGQIVYWVLPGKRRLGAVEWGTPEQPKALLTPVMQRANTLPAPLDSTVPQLLQDLPILGGLPLQARETNADGTAFTTTKGPTAVSDKGRIVSGEFQVTYGDRQVYDLPGTLTDTLDTLEASATFTDPAGNEYELVVDQLWQPPIPGWETGGGVVTNSWIHGTSGTESPLFPRVFTWGAFWGVGKVIVNGEVVNDNQWIHFMTTQTVRDEDYRLVTQADLPLAPEETFAGQVHQTHVIVRPVQFTPDGPVFEPVHTAFELPNGQTQPFLHIMFEQDTIVRGAFKEWSPGSIPESAATTPSDGIVVEGTEFALTPEEVTVPGGEEVTIVYENTGGVAHNLMIGGLDVKSDTVQPGETTTITFTPTETGTFPIWCDLPGHRDAGMEGQLVVTE